MLLIGVFLVIMFLVLCSGSAFAATITDTRFEESLPITCTIIVFTLLVFGVCGQLLLGVYTLCALILTIYIYAAYFFIKNIDRRRSILARLFTPGSAIFAILFVILIYINFGRYPHLIDEFSHWADVVKAMILLDDFGTNPAANTLFPSYPPGMSLLQYFFEHIYMAVRIGKPFCEWLLYPVYQIFALSFLFPFFSRLSLKRPLSFVLAVILLLMPTAYANIYASLYIDSFIAVIFGSAMAMIFTAQDKNYQLVFTVCSCCILVLCKAVGLLFAASVAITYSLVIIKSQLYRKGKIRSCCFVVLAVIVPFLLWAIERKTAQIAQSFSSKDGLVEIETVLDLIFHKDTGPLQAIHDNFYAQLFAFRVEFFGLQISTWIPFFISILILILSIRLYKIYRPEEYIRQKILIPALLLTAFVYIVGLCYTYIFMMAEYEATSLQSFGRYISSMLGAIIYCVFLVVISLANDSRCQKYVLAFVSVLIMLWSQWKTSLHIIKRDMVEESRSLYTQYYPILSIEEASLSTDTPAKIFYVYRDFGISYYTLRYYGRPHTCQSLNSFRLCEPLSVTSRVDIDQCKEYLFENFDYLAIYNYDDYFAESYSALFSQDSPIENNALYWINHESGKLEKCS